MIGVYKQLQQLVFNGVNLTVTVPLNGQGGVFTLMVPKETFWPWPIVVVTPPVVVAVAIQLNNAN